MGNATKAPLSEAFVRIAELALLNGSAPINRLPGPWTHAFTSGDWHWQIAVNGHREPVVSPWSTVLIDPFEAHVYVNGWPFGILSPAGGRLGAGHGANENSFIAALVSEADRLRGVTA